jgi:hypothetical protein
MVKRVTDGQNRLMLPSYLFSMFEVVLCFDSKIVGNFSDTDNCWSDVGGNICC